MLEAEKMQKEITSSFKVVFQSQSGERVLNELERAFVDRPIYQKGQTLEETAYRQGQCDLVRQILKEVNRNGN